MLSQMKLLPADQWTLSRIAWANTGQKIPQMSELTGSNHRCRARFKCAQTVVGQRFAGNGHNGLSYYYYNKVSILIVVSEYVNILAQIRYKLWTVYLFIEHVHRISFRLREITISFKSILHKRTMFLRPSVIR